MQTIGIAGGGQLGRMLAEAAHELKLRVVVLDPTLNSPAAQVADEHYLGDYTDALQIHDLATKCDVLTYEIESVNADALEQLAARGFPVHPTPKTLSIIKDKFVQKEFLAQRDIPVAPYLPIDIQDDIETAAETFGYPFIVKARQGGFDGRGNMLVSSESDLANVGLRLVNSPIYAEKIVPFQKELAIIAARTVQGDMQIYPLVETIHVDHQCHMVFAPAAVSKEVTKRAHELAEKVLASFDGAGVFGIEMFLVGEEVMVNEIAPRVHNSGHFSIEACYTSQFENHMRAVSGMDLGHASMKEPAACMINIIGARDGFANPQGVADAQKIEGVAVHMYGKMETRMKRKMGHVTAVGKTLAEAKERAERAHSLIFV